MEFLEYDDDYLKYFSFQCTQWARKLKKVQAKKLVKSIFFREISFLGCFKLFPSTKIDFWPFLKLQKNRTWSKKKFSWNWFIWFHEFLWPGLFSNFLAHSIYREWWFFGGISMSSQSEIILERIFWLVFSSRDHMCDVKIVNYTSRLLHLISGMLLKSFSSSRRRLFA